MAADEKSLGDLHTQVAKVLSVLLDGQRIEGETYEEDGVMKTTEATVIPPSAAVLQVAAKFLKDNNITAIASKGSVLDELQQRMEARAKARTERATKADREGATQSMNFTQGLLDS